MRHQRFAALALLLVWFPILLMAGNPPGATSFSKQVPGTDRQVPITNATFSDKVYFEMHISTEDGEHSLQVTVYDGEGREVCNSESTVVAEAGQANRAVSYGFDTRRDAPGTWWYVAALDNKVVLSSSLIVSR